jgi:peptide/nickel transport system permease protein
MSAAVAVPLARAPSRSPTAILVGKLFRRKLVLAGAAILVVVTLLALFAPWITPYGPMAMKISDRLQSPRLAHWFGTDELGRDVYSRVLYGAQISMTVGLLATALSVLLGAALGVVSGYFGRTLDLVLQRVVDAWLAFPGLVMVIVLLVLLGPGLASVILALGLSQAFPQSRIIRSATLVVREHAYIEASRASGASHARVLLRHVLPNIVAPIIVSASSYISFVILVEAAVSFLGYGVPPPRPSWGGMLSATGRSYMVRAPWLSIFPGLALTLAIVAFNILGDALRDLLDPRLRTA